jgi:YVTN family beta-propeller protein
VTRTILKTLVLALLPALGAAQPLEPEETRALVLDRKGQALVAVDLRAGAVTRRSALSGDASFVLRAGTDGRVAVIDGGPQKYTFCCGLQPKGPITATLLDARTLEPVAQQRVGWGIAEFGAVGLRMSALQAATLPSPDGRRLALLCAGYHSKNPAEELPRELVTLDVEAGRIDGRVAIDRPVDSIWGTPDGQTAVIFASREEDRDWPRPAELLFVDRAAHALAARVTLTGAPSQTLMAPGGRWLYLLDVGKPSNKPEKNVNGRLAIVSVQDRRVATVVEVGSAPRALIWDDIHQTVVVPSDGPLVGKGNKRGGTLRVFSGSDLVGTVALADEPHLVRLRGARAYVAGKGVLSLIDLDAMRRLTDIPLDDAEDLSELVFSSDSERAFALFGGSSRLSVLDIRTPRLVGSLTTGRGGVKFAKALGAVALSVAASTASYYQGQSVARTQGRNWFTYNIYNFGVAAAEASVVVRPDGRFAYALNTQSNDVTVVDTATASVVSKEAVKGRALAALPGGTRFAVLGKDELWLFDMHTQRPGEPLRFEDADGVALLLTRDGQTALAYGGRTLYVLDGRTGAVRRQVPGLLSIGMLMFDAQP